MSDDTAQDLLVVFKRMTEELNSLNQNINYIADRFNNKSRDNNIELLLKEISIHLMSKINEELCGCELCSSCARINYDNAIEIS